MSDGPMGATGDNGMSTGDIYGGGGGMGFIDAVGEAMGPFTGGQSGIFDLLADGPEGSGITMTAGDWTTNIGGFMGAGFDPNTSVTLASAGWSLGSFEQWIASGQWMLQG